MENIKLNDVYFGVDNTNYISLGFTLESQDGIHFDVTLPEGWSLRKILDNVGYLIDDSLRIRGRVYKNNHFTSILLNTYYKVYKTVNKENSFQKEIQVYFGTGDEVIYNAGVVKVNRYTYIGDTVNKEIELENKAKEYANINYPGWDNPINYWDNEYIRK